MIDHNVLIVIGVVALIVLAFLALDRGCRCEKCSFHVNEARLTRLRRKEEAHQQGHKLGYTCNNEGCEFRKRVD